MSDPKFQRALLDYHGIYEEWFEANPFTTTAARQYRAGFSMCVEDCIYDDVFKMFGYRMAPIDIGWELLRTVEEVVVLLVKRDLEAPAKFLDRWKKAQLMAGNMGWEGDLRGHARVLVFPDEVEMGIGFAFKQNNNGTTFVVTPVPLHVAEENPPC